MSKLSLKVIFYYWPTLFTGSQWIWQPNTCEEAFRRGFTWEEKNVLWLWVLHVIYVLSCNNRRCPCTRGFIFLCYQDPICTKIGHKNLERVLIYLLHRKAFPYSLCSIQVYSQRSRFAVELNQLLSSEWVWFGSKHMVVRKPHLHEWESCGNFCCVSICPLGTDAMQTTSWLLIFKWFCW